MNAARRRKLFWIVLFLTVLSGVLALVGYALRQNISLFYTPSDLLRESRESSSSSSRIMKQKIRLGGMVEKGSLQRVPNDLSVHFKITDYKHSIRVSYRGILPDLFREGQGIVALGEWVPEGYFRADEVLAKHDANYMPPEVKGALGAGGGERISAGKPLIRHFVTPSPHVWGEGKEKPVVDHCVASSPHVWGESKHLGLVGVLFHDC